LNEDQCSALVDRLKLKANANSEDNDESMMIDDESYNGEDEAVDDHGAPVNTENFPTALAFLLESDDNDADMVNDAEMKVNT